MSIWTRLSHRAHRFPKPRAQPDKLSEPLLFLYPRWFASAAEASLTSDITEHHGSFEGPYYHHPRVETRGGQHGGSGTVGNVPAEAAKVVRLASPRPRKRAASEAVPLGNVQDRDHRDINRLYHDFLDQELDHNNSTLQRIGHAIAGPNRKANSSTSEHKVYASRATQGLQEELDQLEAELRDISSAIVGARRTGRSFTGQETISPQRNAPDMQPRNSISVTKPRTPDGYPVAPEDQLATELPEVLEHLDTRKIKRAGLRYLKRKYDGRLKRREWYEQYHQNDYEHEWSECYRLLARMPHHSSAPKSVRFKARPGVALRLQERQSMFRVKFKMKTGCDIHSMEWVDDELKEFVVTGSGAAMKNAVMQALSGLLEIAPGDADGLVPFDVQPLESVDDEPQATFRTEWSGEATQNRRWNGPANLIPRPEQWDTLSFRDYVTAVTHAQPSYQVKHLTMGLRPHVNEVRDILMDLFHPGNMPYFSVDAFLHAVSYLVKHQKYRSVRILVKRITRDDLLMKTEFWNALLRGFAVKYNMTAFKQTLILMKEQKSVPNAGTWTALLMCAWNLRRQLLVRNTMYEKDMLDGPGVSAEVAKHIIPDYVLHQIARGESTLENILTQADQLFEDPKWLSTQCANEVLDIFLSTGHVDQAIDLLSRVYEERNIRPSHVTLNTLLAFCARTDNIRAAIELFCISQRLWPTRLYERTFEQLFALAWGAKAYNVAKVVWTFAGHNLAVSGHMRRSVWKSLRTAIELHWQQENEKSVRGNVLDASLREEKGVKDDGEELLKAQDAAEETGESDLDVLTGFPEPLDPEASGQTNPLAPSKPSNYDLRQIFPRTAGPIILSLPLTCLSLPPPGSSLTPSQLATDLINETTSHLSSPHQRPLNSLTDELIEAYYMDRSWRRTGLWFSKDLDWKIENARVVEFTDKPAKVKRYGKGVVVWRPGGGRALPFQGFNVPRI